MPVKSTIAVCALAALALTMAGSARPAAAQELHLGNSMVDALVNNALAARRSYYGVGDPRCPLVRTSDGYGNYVGWIHTCELPPTISHGVIQLHSRRLIVGHERRRAVRR
jgi:hypothetical protein